MRLGGDGADDRAGGDLLIARAPRGERGDLAFAAGEVFQAGRADAVRGRETNSAGTARRTARPGAALHCSTTPGPAPAGRRDGRGPACAALCTTAAVGAGPLAAEDRDVLRQVLRSRDGSHPPVSWAALPDRARRPGAAVDRIESASSARVGQEAS